MAKRIYIADYRDANGKRRRSQHATREEADRVEAAGKAAAGEVQLKKLSRTVAKLKEVAAR